MTFFLAHAFFLLAQPKYAAQDNCPRGGSDPAGSRDAPRVTGRGRSRLVPGLRRVFLASRFLPHLVSFPQVDFTLGVK
jgi:hypothetical protein